MKKVLLAIRHFLSDRFNLAEDKADEKLITESIRREVTFKGTNVWTLIFAIFIASIGLNVNSTAVIIGAMLISPLMGPIMGTGLGIAINDYELLKTGIKNLFIATFISVATSSLYFSISPLHDTSSELLARTNPSVWDVFIAFFGGLAGIVAGTRREKSNTIPGVAIATALMPPLCTAGFGLATGHWYYFFGAVYLFFINSLFICLATYLMIKHLKFHRKDFASPKIEKRVSRSIFIIAIVTIVPSVFLTYRIVQRSIFESNAKKFIHNEFHFNKTQVVIHNYNFDKKQKSIELMLVGQPLSETRIDSIRLRMPKYGLDSTELTVHQGLDAKQKIDLAAIKASVLEEVFAADTISEIPGKMDLPIPDLKNELKALYPDIITYSLHQAIFNHADSIRKDTITLFIGKFNHPLPSKERSQLGVWIKQRIHADSVKLVFE